MPRDMCVHECYKQKALLPGALGTPQTTFHELAFSNRNTFGVTALPWRPS
jgi:hypothetical protein